MAARSAILMPLAAPISRSVARGLTIQDTRAQRHCGHSTDTPIRWRTESLSGERKLAKACRERWSVAIRPLSLIYEAHRAAANEISKVSLEAVTRPIPRWRLSPEFSDLALGWAITSVLCDGETRAYAESVRRPVVRRAAGYCRVVSSVGGAAPWSC